jgi:WXG100 family type VII secretion target
MSKERFFQQFEQWKGSMTQFVQLLNQIGTEMDAIAARMAVADGQGQ